MAAFLIFFFTPIATLVRDWVALPEAGHGLLLAPLAGFLAWRRGILPDARPRPGLGFCILAAAVFMLYLGALAAELFSMRVAMLLAIVGLIVFWLGTRQVLHWWLPLTLLALTIPLPAVLLSTLSLPLQLKASQLGATLLEWRQVPVLLAGNVIHLPGRSLFVTEACSGLRSLTALLSLGVLVGGVSLRSPLARTALIVATIPLALLVNGVRVFLTGFLAYYFGAGLGEGFLHYTEGWALFLVAMLALGVLAWVLMSLERRRNGAV